MMLDTYLRSHIYIKKIKDSKIENEDQINQKRQSHSSFLTGKSEIKFKRANKSTYQWYMPYHILDKNNKRSQYVMILFTRKSKKSQRHLGVILLVFMGSFFLFFNFKKIIKHLYLWINHLYFIKLIKQNISLYSFISFTFVI